MNLVSDVWFLIPWFGLLPNMHVELREAGSEKRMGEMFYNAFCLEKPRNVFYMYFVLLDNKCFKIIHLFNSVDMSFDRFET